MNLKDEIYHFLREGDDFTPSPESMGLTMELGTEEHFYLAECIAGFIERNYILFSITLIPND